MSTRYPGGFINRSAPVIVGPTNGEGGSAPGVWTLEQASYYTKQGTWPQRVKDRPLFSWGNNGQGQLGQNNLVYKSSPTQIGSLTTWSNISAGWYHSLFVQNNGTLWSCGQNNIGQLGQSDATNRSSPTQVGALTTWSKISGGSYTSVAIKTDGTLWSWGQNDYGQLGDGTKTNRSSPVQIGNLTNWSKISSGYLQTFAIKTDGTLWAWGSNSSYQLGLGNAQYRSSPVQVGNLTTWTAIVTSSSCGIAIQSNGTMWSWGSGYLGQLGLNVPQATFVSSPTQIGALTTWLTIGLGYYDGFAIKTDGTLWSWGYNSFGQLGQNIATSVIRSSPVQVGNLNTWLSVSCGKYHTFAKKSDGTLWSWGRNNSGELGQNNNIYRSSPVQVGPLTNWGSVVGGAGVSLAYTET